MPLQKAHRIICLLTLILNSALIASPEMACENFAGVYEDTNSGLRMEIKQNGCSSVTLINNANSTNLAIGAFATDCDPEDPRTSIRAQFIDAGRTLNIIGHYCDENTHKLSTWKWWEDVIWLNGANSLMDNQISYEMGNNKVSFEETISWARVH